jgi:hypothetical protein
MLVLRLDSLPSPCSETEKKIVINQIDSRKCMHNKHETEEQKEPKEFEASNNAV